MSRHRKTDAAGVDTLAKDARALLHATSDVAGEKVAEARERLSTALERGREIYDRARERAIESARTGDQFVRRNPYAVAGIALGIGAVIGILLCRRKGD
ncbi:MAG TPA: DUF883 family protein [Candidatus Acidoferrum sp.]|nr:DUF883 family protein [Candidatus Acidoferrum sp.]